MRFKYKNREIKINARRMSYFGKFIGLMFRTSGTRNLLFEFDEDSRISIHSFFVFFSFLAVWLDSKNNVIDKRIVHPWRFSVAPRKPFRKLIEIPVNEQNKIILRMLGKS